MKDLLCPALMELTQVKVEGWVGQTVIKQTVAGSSVSSPQDKFYSVEWAKYLTHETFSEKLLCARPRLKVRLLRAFCVRPRRLDFILNLYTGGWRRCHW